MSVLHERLGDIKELAIIAALNTGAGAFIVVTTTNSPEALAAKDQLMKLVTGVVRDNGTIVLTLDLFGSLRVRPLYGVFASCWLSPRVREAVLETLRNCSVLDGVTYDLQLTTR
jgi:hypothetical protein